MKWGTSEKAKQQGMFGFTNDSPPNGREQEKEFSWFFESMPDGSNRNRNLMEALGMGVDGSYTEWYNKRGEHLENFKYEGKLRLRAESILTDWERVGKNEIGYTDFLMEHYGKDILRQESGIDVDDPLFWYNRYKSGDFSDPLEDTALIDQVSRLADGYHQQFLEGMYASHKLSEIATEIPITDDEMLQTFSVLNAYNEHFGTMEKAEKMFRANAATEQRFSDDGQFYYDSQGNVKRVIEANDVNAGADGFATVYRDDAGQIYKVKVDGGDVTFWEDLAGGFVKSILGFIEFPVLLTTMQVGLVKDVIDGEWDMDALQSVSSTMENWKNEIGLLRQETLYMSDADFWEDGERFANTAGQVGGFISGMLATMVVGSLLAGGGAATSAAGGKVVAGLADDVAREATEEAVKLSIKQLSKSAVTKARQGVGNFLMRQTGFSMGGNGGTIGRTVMGWTDDVALRAIGKQGLLKTASGELTEAGARWASRASFAMTMGLRDAVDVASVRARTMLIDDETGEIIPPSIGDIYADAAKTFAINSVVSFALSGGIDDSPLHDYAKLMSPKTRASINPQSGVGRYLFGQKGWIPSVFMDTIDNSVTIAVQNANMNNIGFLESYKSIWQDPGTVMNMAWMARADVVGYKKTIATQDVRVMNGLELAFNQKLDADYEAANPVKRSQIQDIKVMYDTTKQEALASGKSHAEAIDIAFKTIEDLDPVAAEYVGRIGKDIGKEYRLKEAKQAVGLGSKMKAKGKSALWNFAKDSWNFGLKDTIYSRIDGRLKDLHIQQQGGTLYDFFRFQEGQALLQKVDVFDEESFELYINKLLTDETADEDLSDSFNGIDFLPPSDPRYKKAVADTAEGPIKVTDEDFVIHVKDDRRRTEDNRIKRQRVNRFLEFLGRTKAGPSLVHKIGEGLYVIRIREWKAAQTADPKQKQQILSPRAGGQMNARYRQPDMMDFIEAVTQIRRAAKAFKDLEADPMNAQALETLAELSGVAEGVNLAEQLKDRKLDRQGKATFYRLVNELVNSIVMTAEEGVAQLNYYNVKAYHNSNLRRHQQVIEVVDTFTIKADGTIDLQNINKKKLNEIKAIVTDPKNRAIAEQYMTSAQWDVLEAKLTAASNFHSLTPVELAELAIDLHTSVLQAGSEYNRKDIEAVIHQMIKDEMIDVDAGKYSKITTVQGLLDKLVEDGILKKTAIAKLKKDGYFNRIYNQRTRNKEVYSTIYKMVKKGQITPEIYRSVMNKFSGHFERVTIESHVRDYPVDRDSTEIETFLRRLQHEGVLDDASFEVMRDTYMDEYTTLIPGDDATETEYMRPKDYLFKLHKEGRLVDGQGRFLKFEDVAKDLETQGWFTYVEDYSYISPVHGGLVNLKKGWIDSEGTTFTRGDLATYLSNKYGWNTETFRPIKEFKPKAGVTRGQIVDELKVSGPKVTHEAWQQKPDSDLNSKQVLDYLIDEHGVDALKGLNSEDSNERIMRHLIAEGHMKKNYMTEIFKKTSKKVEDIRKMLNSLDDVSGQVSDKVVINLKELQGATINKIQRRLRTRNSTLAKMIDVFDPNIDDPVDFIRSMVKQKVIDGSPEKIYHEINEQLDKLHTYIDTEGDNDVVRVMSIDEATRLLQDLGYENPYFDSDHIEQEIPGVYFAGYATKGLKVYGDFDRVLVQKRVLGETEVMDHPDQVVQSVLNMNGNFRFIGDNDHIAPDEIAILGELDPDNIVIGQVDSRVNVRQGKLGKLGGRSKKQLSHVRNGYALRVNADTDLTNGYIVREILNALTGEVSYKQVNGKWEVEYKPNIKEDMGAYYNTTEEGLANYIKAAGYKDEAELAKWWHIGRTTSDGRTLVHFIRPTEALIKKFAPGATGEMRLIELLPVVLKKDLVNDPRHTHSRSDRGDASGILRPESDEFGIISKASFDQVWQSLNIPDDFNGDYLRNIQLNQPITYKIPAQFNSDMNIRTNATVGELIARYKGSNDPRHKAIYNTLVLARKYSDGVYQQLLASGFFGSIKDKESHIRIMKAMSDPEFLKALYQRKRYEQKNAPASLNVKVVSHMDRTYYGHRESDSYLTKDFVPHDLNPIYKHDLNAEERKFLRAMLDSDEHKKHLTVFNKLGQRDDPKASLQAKLSVLKGDNKSKFIPLEFLVNLSDAEWKELAKYTGKAESLKKMIDEVYGKEDIPVDTTVEYYIAKGPHTKNTAQFMKDVELLENSYRLRPRRRMIKAYDFNHIQRKRKFDLEVRHTLNNPDSKLFTDWTDDYERSRAVYNIARMITKLVDDEKTGIAPQYGKKFTQQQRDNLTKSLMTMYDMTSGTQFQKEYTGIFILGEDMNIHHQISVSRAHGKYSGLTRKILSEASTDQISDDSFIVMINKNALDREGNPELRLIKYADAKDDLRRIALMELRETAMKNSRVRDLWNKEVLTPEEAGTLQRFLSNYMYPMDTKEQFTSEVSKIVGATNDVAKIEFQRTLGAVLDSKDVTSGEPSVSVQGLLNSFGFTSDQFTDVALDNNAANRGLFDMMVYGMNWRAFDKEKQVEWNTRIIENADAIKQDMIDNGLIQSHVPIIEEAVKQYTLVNSTAEGEVNAVRAWEAAKSRMKQLIEAHPEDAPDILKYFLADLMKHNRSGAVLEYATGRKNWEQHAPHQFAIEEGFGVDANGDNVRMTPEQLKGRKLYMFDHEAFFQGNDSDAFQLAWTRNTVGDDGIISKQEGDVTVRYVDSKIKDINQMSGENTDYYNDTPGYRQAVGKWQSAAKESKIDILTDLINQIEADNGILVTFNGRAYDIPRLLKDMPQDLVDRFNKVLHFDVHEYNTKSNIGLGFEAKRQTQEALLEAYGAENMALRAHDAEGDILAMKVLYEKMLQANMDAHNAPYKLNKDLMDMGFAKDNFKQMSLKDLGVTGLEPAYRGGTIEDMATINTLVRHFEKTRANRAIMKDLREVVRTATYRDVSDYADAKLRDGQDKNVVRLFNMLQIDGDDNIIEGYLKSVGAYSNRGILDTLLGIGAGEDTDFVEYYNKRKGTNLTHDEIMNKLNATDAKWNGTDERRGQLRQAEVNARNYAVMQSMDEVKKLFEESAELYGDEGILDLFADMQSLTGRNTRKPISPDSKEGRRLIVTNRMHQVIREQMRSFGSKLKLKADAGAYAIVTPYDAIIRRQNNGETFTNLLNNKAQYVDAHTIIMEKKYFEAETGRTIEEYREMFGDYDQPYAIFHRQPSDRQAPLHPTKIMVIEDAQYNNSIMMDRNMLYTYQGDFDGDYVTMFMPTNLNMNRLLKNLNHYDSAKHDFISKIDQAVSKFGLPEGKGKLGKYFEPARVEQFLRTNATEYTKQIAKANDADKFELYKRFRKDLINKFMRKSGGIDPDLKPIVEDYIDTAWLTALPNHNSFVNMTDAEYIFFRGTMYDDIFGNIDIEDFTAPKILEDRFAQGIISSLDSITGVLDKSTPYNRMDGYFNYRDGNLEKGLHNKIFRAGMLSPDVAYRFNTLGRDDKIQIVSSVLHSMGITDFDINKLENITSIDLQNLAEISSVYRREQTSFRKTLNDSIRDAIAGDDAHLFQDLDDTIDNVQMMKEILNRNADEYYARTDYVSDEFARGLHKELKDTNDVIKSQRTDVTNREWNEDHPFWGRTHMVRIAIDDGTSKRGFVTEDTMWFNKNGVIDLDGDAFKTEADERYELKVEGTTKVKVGDKVKKGQVLFVSNAKETDGSNSVEIRASYPAEVIRIEDGRIYVRETRDVHESIKVSALGGSMFKGTVHNPVDITSANGKNIGFVASYKNFKPDQLSRFMNSTFGENMKISREQVTIDGEQREMQVMNVPLYVLIDPSFESTGYRVKKMKNPFTKNLNVGRTIDELTIKQIIPSLMNMAVFGKNNFNVDQHSNLLAQLKNQWTPDKLDRPGRPYAQKLQLVSLMNVAKKLGVNIDNANQKFKFIFTSKELVGQDGYSLKREILNAIGVRTPEQAYQKLVQENPDGLTELDRIILSRQFNEFTKIPDKPTGYDYDNEGDVLTDPTRYEAATIESGASYDARKALDNSEDHILSTLPAKHVLNYVLGELGMRKLSNGELLTATADGVLRNTDLEASNVGNGFIVMEGKYTEDLSDYMMKMGTAEMYKMGAYATNLPGLRTRNFLDNVRFEGKGIDNAEYNRIIQTKPNQNSRASLSDRAENIVMKLSDTQDASTEGKRLRLAQKDYSNLIDVEPVRYSRFLNDNNELKVNVVSEKETARKIDSINDIYKEPYSARFMAQERPEVDPAIAGEAVRGFDRDALLNVEAEPRVLKGLERRTDAQVREDYYALANPFPGLDSNRISTANPIQKYMYRNTMKLRKDPLEHSGIKYTAPEVGGVQDTVGGFNRSKMAYEWQYGRDIIELEQRINQMPGGYEEFGIYMAYKELDAMMRYSDDPSEFDPILKQYNIDKDYMLKYIENFERSRRHTVNQFNKTSNMLWEANQKLNGQLDEMTDVHPYLLFPTIEAKNADGEMLKYREISGAMFDDNKYKTTADKIHLMFGANPIENMSKLAKNIAHKQALVDMTDTLKQKGWSGNSTTIDLATDFVESVLIPKAGETLIKNSEIRSQVEQLLRTEPELIGRNADGYMDATETFRNIQQRLLEEGVHSVDDLNLKYKFAETESEKMYVDNLLTLHSVRNKMVQIIASDNDSAGQFYSWLKAKADTMNASITDRFLRDITIEGIKGFDVKQLAFDSFAGVNQQLRLTGKDDASISRKMLAYALEGGVFFTNKDVSNQLNTSFYRTKVPQTFWQKALRNVAIWASKMYVASPIRVPERVWRFMGFDLSMSMVNHPKMIFEMGKSARMLSMMLQSKGNAFKDIEYIKDSDTFVDKNGNEIDYWRGAAAMYYYYKGLTPGQAGKKDPEIKEIDVGRVPGLGKWNDVMEASLSAIEYGSDLSRLALFMRHVKDIKENRNMMYGSAYKKKAYIDSIDDPFLKAYRLTSENATMPGDLPILAKKLFPYTIFTSFPLGATRVARDYGIGMSKAMRSGNPGDMIRNAAVPAIATAMTLGLTYGMINWVSDMFDVDERTEEQWKERGVTFDPFASIIAGEPVARAASNPFLTLVEEYWNPIGKPLFEDDTTLGSYLDGIKNAMLSKGNPLIKIPYEVTAKKDIFGPNSWDTSETYTRTQNTLRKLGAFLMGNSGSNAMTNYLQGSKYRDQNFAQEFANSMLAALSAEFGNSKGYKRERSDFYNAYSLVYNFKQATEGSIKVDLEPPFSGEGNYNGFDYEVYKDLYKRLRRAYLDNVSGEELYAMITEAYQDPSIGEAEFKSALKKVSLSQQLANLGDYDKFIESLNQKDMMMVERALAYEAKYYGFMRNIDLSKDDDAAPYGNPLDYQTRQIKYNLPRKPYRNDYKPQNYYNNKSPINDVKIYPSMGRYYNRYDNSGMYERWRR